MSSNSPLWVSITRNAYNQNSGTPEITRRVQVTRMAKYNRPIRAGEINGLRGLPHTVVEQIFLMASHESSATRWNLTRTCKSWRSLALNDWRMWSPLSISKDGEWSDELVLAIEGCKARYWGIPVQVRLESPSSLQLVDFVSFAPPNQWESLYIQLGPNGLDAPTIEAIFKGSSFSSLKSLCIEEKGVCEELDAEFGPDPYGALYDAIFLTANKLEKVHIDSDIRALAPQYGLFCQPVKWIGGSASFVANSLAVSSEAGPYLHLTRLSLYRWDSELFKNLTIPNLRYLQVDHCLRDEAWTRNSFQPSILLPSLLEIHLTAHSLPALSQVCAGSLEALVVDGKNYEKWYERLDGCLPPDAEESYAEESYVYLSPLILDVWSTPALESVELRTQVDIQHLLTFLHNAKGLRHLTLAVPNEREWCAAFVGGMDARWGCDQHLAHCAELETLTLLMNWDYSEGEWLYEIRQIFDRREGTPLRSIICRWTGDNRHPESGPAGDFSVFGGEYYGAASEPELGPNLPSESKQVETHTPEDDDESMEDDRDDSADDMDEWDEDDQFGSYDDIPFP